MAEVRMSLKEYDEMREELNLYKRILSKFLTPIDDSWEMEWYHEHPESTLTLHAEPMRLLDNAEKKLVESMILENVDTNLGDVSTKDIYVTIAKITHPDNSSKATEV